MSKSNVIPVLRALVRCYQSFERASIAHLRSTGLTAPQFDIVATLGNTEGMTFKALGERTLITKGTLTGIVDRLAERGLVDRCECPGDKRATIVRLTRRGERVFEQVFEPHLAFLQPAFDSMGDADRAALTRGLHQLREALDERIASLAPTHRAA